MPSEKKNKPPRVIPFIVTTSVIVFFIVTANSAVIGKDFLYRKDIYGWPNIFLEVTYEKAVVVNFALDIPNILTNLILIMVPITAIRILFLLMRVKKRIER